jgi:AcrR family transcriptional regulator
MEEDKIQKKEKIFDAAFEAFLEKGYANTKMSEIAASAGIAKATLYDYFASKEALFDELLHTKVIIPYLSFEERLDANASCASRIRHFMRMEMDFLFNFMNEKEVRPNLLLQNDIMGNETVASAAYRIISFKFRVICGLLREGMDNGEFREGEPVLTAACMIGAFNLYAACACKAHLHLLNLPVRFPEYGESEELFFDVIFDGIKAPAVSADETR